MGGGLRDDTGGEVADDGSRVFWEALSPGDTAKHLYMTDLDSEKSVQVDAAQGAAEGEGEEIRDGMFRTASSDGSEVFFTSGRKLTPESTAGGKEDYDLYAYDAEAPEDSRLTDLTVDHNAGETANVRGALLGASEDGSYVYFVATGVLSSGENAQGEKAVRSADNLYLAHRDGAQGWTTTYITTLVSEDAGDWAGGPTDENQFYSLDELTARVTPDGRYLAFMSQRSLTGFHNIDAVSGAADQEVYEYDASANSIVCASCNPSGARPTGIYDHDLAADVGKTHEGEWLAASIPGWTALLRGEAYYQPRYLSNSGRLFFDSPEAYVPDDANGVEDVYEYEPGGVGTCTSGAGCIGPISAGAGPEESLFEDASANGNDVFFRTAVPLVGEDHDTSYDLYDAHVCSAAEPCSLHEASLPQQKCGTGEACRPLATPVSVFGSPASSTPSSDGNLLAPAPVKSTVKPLTRTQKLAKALKACRRDMSKSKRLSCEALARKRYGAKRSVITKRKGAKR